MATKKGPRNQDKARKKLTVNRETLKDLGPTSRQGKAAKGGAKKPGFSCIPSLSANC